MSTPEPAKDTSARATTEPTPPPRPASPAPDDLTVFGLVSDPNRRVSDLRHALPLRPDGYFDRNPDRTGPDIA